MANKHNDLKEKLEAGVKEHVPEEHVPEEHAPEEHAPEEHITEEVHYDATNEEIAAGKAANTVWEQRAKAEADAGRKLVALNEARAKKAAPKEDIPKEDTTESK